MKELLLRKNEKLHHIFRRSKWTLLWPLLGGCFFITLAFFLLFRLLQLDAVGYIVFSLLIGLGVIIIARATFFWRHTELIVTNQRILDKDRQSLLRKTISEYAHDDVAEVLGEIKGFTGSILRLGTLTIQPKDLTTQILITHVPAPHRAQQLINAAKHADKELTPKEVMKLCKSMKTADLYRLEAFIGRLIKQRSNEKK